MKHFIRIIVALSVLDILGLGLLWFEYATILAKQGDETGLRKEISAEKQKGAEFMDTQKIVTQAQKESGVLLKYLYDPGEESQISFLAQIEALGVATSHALVEMKSLELVSGEAPGFHGELTVKGTWREAYHFLRLVETFPAHIVINRFSVATPDQKSASTALWTGGMSITLMGLKNL